LPEPERRVRIEVAFNSEELRNLGIVQVSDLHAFNFVRLQGKFFRFMKPTFVDLDLVSDARRRLVTGYLEKERHTKFYNAGVLGLNAMDEAIKRSRNRNRAQLRRVLQGRGKRLGPARRIGTGAVCTLVAFDKINAKVETALRHLGERVCRG
jgi:hypothetical protein